jgi:HK97 family phage major capsid protein
MDYKTMESAALEERLSKIVEEATEERSLEELTALENEQKGIRAELEARKANEAERRATAERIAAGEADAVVIERKENTTMNEERTFKPDTTEYRDAYMKSLMGKPMSIEERQALTSAASVIPTITLDRIYGKLAENPLIRELDPLRIPGYVSVPKATTVNDATWLAMGTASTDSADVVGSVQLSAKKLIKTIEITADIQAMSIDAFQSWLVNKLVEKMEAAICAAVISGAGSTDAYGVAARVTAGTAISGVTIAKLGTLMGTVGAAYHRNAVWVMTPATFFGKILGLANDYNGVLVNNGIDYMLLGHRVILDANANGKWGNEQAATEHVIFGSFRDGYVFNYGEGINVEADQSVAFRSGSTVYRAMALCDGDVVDTEAFAYAAIS